MLLYWTVGSVILLLAHKSIALDDDVVIKVKYDSTGVIFYNILFSVTEFKSFHSCLCRGKNCRALYDVGNAPNIDVQRVTEETPTPADSGQDRLYKCTNSPSTNSLFCERQSQLQNPNPVFPQTFKVRGSSCDSTCIVLTRAAVNEGIDFNHESISAEFCNTDCTQCKPANATGDHYNTITAPPLTHVGTGSGFTDVSTTTLTTVPSTTRHILITAGDTTTHPPGTEKVSESILESTEKDDPDSGVNAAVIAGIVLGAIMLIVVVAIFAFVFLRGRKSRNHGKYETSSPGNVSTSPSPRHNPTVEHLGVASLDTASPDNSARLQNGNGVTAEHVYSVISPDSSYIRAGSDLDLSDSRDGDRADVRSSGFHYDVAKTLPTNEGELKSGSPSNASREHAKGDSTNDWILNLETVDDSSSDDEGVTKPGAGNEKRGGKMNGTARSKPASEYTIPSAEVGDSLQIDDNSRHGDKSCVADDSEDYGYAVIALDYSIGPYQNVQPESKSSSETSDPENASSVSNKSWNGTGHEQEDSDSDHRQSHVLTDHAVVGSEC